MIVGLLAECVQRIDGVLRRLDLAEHVAGAAGGMITALGGWTVLLLAVGRIAKELPGGGNCLHYDARLIARCGSVPDQKIRVIDPSHPFAAHAHELLGKRMLGGGGGTITRLAADETV